MADGRFELVMEPTAIRLGSLNSNPETHMTSICDARLIYGRGWISRVFMWCVALKSGPIAHWMVTECHLIRFPHFG